uniref:Syntaxin binding protein 5L n=1 Tax=Bos indicus x Bos taurus TaxID=30522 RepID=A0A4W2FKV7_BOBOX
MRVLWSVQVQTIHFICGTLDKKGQLFFILSNFNRERITYCHLPFQSKWLYVGTERGNTHIVNIESFILSGYVIMWNKAIELSTKTHPGPVVHLSDSPRDEGKLLIGYENGTVVFWDLKSKRAELRVYYDEAIHSIDWHHEGKQFMCSHSDGSLTLWNLKSPSRPFQTTVPHGKSQREGRKPESCKPILKVEYKTCRNSEPFIIFSGGLSYDKACRRPSLTIMHGKAITVLEMDHPIVEFLTLCETPYPNEFQEPYAVAVLLEKDLIVVDLTQSNFPIFENPYPMDIHESPVTCTAYFADCPPDLILVLYSIGVKHKKQGYSNKEWPISGGAWNLGTQTYPEIIITGHADGSIKFWDASANHVNGHCTSPTSQSCSSGKRLSSADVSKINRWGPGRPPFRKAQSAACMEISLPVTTEESRENSYNRSRSSSISSIDKDSKEAITALYFMESFARKNDSTISPCLFVGTSLGMVLIISLNLPSADEQRFTEPVMVLPSGTFLSLKGAVLTFSCMDRTGGLMQPPYEVWRDPNNIDENEKSWRRKLVMNCPSPSQEIGDHQYTIICSEKQAKVFSLPSQTCLYVHNITETSFILQADVVVMCNSACLACFCANGHIMIMSLPSLRPMLDVNYLPLTDMRIARTFCFTNEGQALYLVSPTEIQRLTYSQEMCDNLQDMLGDLFTPIETPEAQNRGFLKGLFGGSGQTFDREELFGEATAGKASRSLAQHIPGPGGIEGMKGAAGGVMGELTRARIALDERGQRLGELEEKTAGMMTSAEAFSKHAHELMLKYKDKKWYQF